MARAGRVLLTVVIAAGGVAHAQPAPPDPAPAPAPSLDDSALLDAAHEQIEIHDAAPLPAAGAAQLDREEIQRLPGAGGDVVRTLTAMPGVLNQQVPQGYSGVVIRGASPQDSKVLVDDFEIPILFHPLGIRAIVPVEAIQSLTFIPGGFDVSYGRASSGIIQLATRPGSDQRSEQAELSVIDGGVVAQGALGDHTHYMIAVRRSVLDLILPSVIPDSVDLSLTTVPQYWDQQLRIDHELSSHWNLSLSTIGTDDVLELFTTKDTDADTKRFYSQTRFLRATAAARYHEGEWSASLALSAIASELRFEVGLFQKLDVVTPQVTPRATVSRTIAEWAGLKNLVWSAGAEAQVSYADIDIAVPLEKREGEPLPPYSPNDTATKFHGTVWYPDFAAWSSIAADLDPRIRTTFGLRVDGFARGGELAIEPRGELQLKLTDKLISRMSAGGYRRPPEFQSELLQASLQSERADQLTFGLEYSPILGTRIQGSLYYTDRSALITHNADDTLGNNGHGSSKGAELLTMIYGGAWFAWIGYSYSRSSRIDTPDGASRLFDYDQTHSLNLALSWKLGAWTLGGRFELYSGLPFTPAVGSEFDSDRNLFLPTYGTVNSERAPIHHQLDLRVDYAWQWGKVAMLAFLDVQNVYLDRSVVTYFYTYDYSQRTAFESIPLIPSAGLRVTL